MNKVRLHNKYSTRLKSAQYHIDRENSLSQKMLQPHHASCSGKILGVNISIFIVQRLITRLKLCIFKIAIPLSSVFIS